MPYTAGDVAGVLVPMAVGVGGLRLALPALYSGAVRRWMNQRGGQPPSFPAAPSMTEAPRSPLPVDRLLAIAVRGRWLAGLAVGLVVIGAAVIVLTLVEPNPVAGRPDVTAPALALESLITLPFLIFALRLPVHPVSWWLSSIVPGLVLGMGFTAIAVFLSGARWLTLYIGALIVGAWLVTIVFLVVMEAITRATGQSSVTSGLTQAAFFGLLMFTYYTWNATHSSRSLLLLTPLLIVGWLLSAALPRAVGPPRTLLLLRTFGSSRRSRRLMNRLVRTWLGVGPAFTVQGPDLARTTLEVRHLLATLTGRLKSRFVREGAQVEATWKRGLHRHRDGRYSLESLYCLDDTWRPTVEMLAARADYLVIDARGFSAVCGGVLFELGLVARVRGVTRVAFLVDGQSDLALLGTTLVAARTQRDLEPLLVRSQGDEGRDMVALLRVLASE